MSKATYIAGGTLIAALGLSVVLTPLIAASAGRHKLVYTTRLDESGSVGKAEALGIAAGPLRGLVINALWLRANELKEAGKFFEAVDLAKTVTKLQPRFPRAWAFHAWNLAYNISVATQTPEERWQWVNAGIRLLRDEGIPANPNDLLLHKELGWLYLHKIQGRMDDANNFYKVRFADEWASVLGPIPVRGDPIRVGTSATPGDAPAPAAPKKIVTRQQLIDARVRYLRQIAQAPLSLQSVRTNPVAAELIDRLKAEGGVDVGTPEGRLSVLRTRALMVAANRQVELLGMARRVPEPLRVVVGLMEEPAYTQVWPGLMSHLRRRELVERYHMEPDRMIGYTEKYGPLDWRHPASHALYWAARGVEQGLNRVSDRAASDYDFINTDRIVIQALQELFNNGEIVYDPTLPQFFQSYPNADFIESYQENLAELAEREARQMKLTKGVEMESRIWTFYNSGYENFVGDATVYLYRLGQIERANDLRLSIAKWPGRNMNDWNKELDRTTNLEDFVTKQITDRLNAPLLAIKEVEGSLRGAYLLGLLAGDEDRFRGQFEYAKRFHVEFFKEQYRLTSLDPSRPRMAPFDPDFRVVAAQILHLVMSSLGPVDSALLYQRAPVDLQQYTYEILDQAERPRDEKGVPNNPTFERLFPPPEGYAQFKALRDAQRQSQPPGQQGARQVQ